MHPSACGFTGGEIALFATIVALLAFAVGVGLTCAFFDAPPKAGQ